MHLKIAALNADNESDVTQLCSLYARSYGSQFTLTKLDATRFWQARVGNRFTTLVIRSGGKLIASVSLRPDRDNDSHIQLYMPVCDPQYLSQAADIRAAVADLLHRLALRQKWEMIYSYQFLQIPEQAWFAHFLVDGVDVALWPASLPAGTKRDKKKEGNGGLGSVLISQRILELPKGHSDEKTVLFSPAEHVEFCRWVYASLGLDFKIASDPVEASNSVSPDLKSPFASNLALSADRRAIERHAHKQAGFSICFVEPSLLASFRDLEKVLERKALSADYVALNMLDPKTPAFAEKLAAKGFGLGGLLPFHRSRHTLLYYKTAQEFDWKSIKQASSLFEYLKTKDSSALSTRSQQEIRKAPGSAASK